MYKCSKEDPNNARNEQTENRSVEMPMRARDQYKRQIYLCEDNVIPENGDTSQSYAERLITLLLEILQINIKNEIKFAILDNLTTRLPPTTKTELLNQITNTELEQIVLLTSQTHLPNPQQHENHNSRIIHLGRPLESLRLVVENFPLQAQVLEDRLSYQFKASTSQKETHSKTPSSTRNKQ